jgi:CubicO group peptidase (beta-lactamase class C family)
MNRRCLRALAASALVLALAAPLLAQPLPRAAKPEEVGLSSERLQRLTSTFDGYVKDGRLAGAVVLVARRGKVAYLRTFGERDVAAHAPMTEDTCFRIASQTKALVSVGAMILQEEGKLLISDPVGKYIPEFQKTKVAVLKPGGYDVVDAKRPITIRDLLTHTSGVSYGDGPAKEAWQKAGITGWYFADRDEPVAATVTRMAALPFDSQPGEKYVYGYSTDILGVVVERASGKPLDEFLRTRLFEPLKMRDTYFYLPPDRAGRLATVYAATDGGKFERAPDGGHWPVSGQGAYVEGPRKSFSGGAGIVSTAGDYARFLQMMLSGGELEGARVLGRKTVELMTVDHLGPIEFPNKGQGFGLGFSVVKDLGLRGAPGSFGEFGWGGAYHSTYWVDPQEQLVVVYFTQLIPAKDIDDHAKLRALVYQAIVDGAAAPRAAAR